MAKRESAHKFGQSHLNFQSVHLLKLRSQEGGKARVFITFEINKTTGNIYSYRFFTRYLKITLPCTLGC